MGPVEVITSVERRRHWSAAQKQAMVEEAESSREYRLIGGQEVRSASLAKVSFDA